MTPEQQLKQLTDALQKAADAKMESKHNEARNGFFNQLGQYLSSALKPIHQAVEEMKKVSNHLGNIEIPTPEVNVDLSQIRIPTPNISVKPIIDISQIKMPEEMDVKGWIGLMGYDRSFLTNPLPVQLRDSNGNPVKLFDNLTQIIGNGGGGGKQDFFTVKGFSASAYADYVNSDNRLRVSVETGGSAITDAELRASAVPVSQVSGANWSVNVVSGSTGGTQYDDGGEASPGTGGLTMARDSAGSVYSVRIGSGTSETALRVLQATDSVASVNIVSGSTSGTQYDDGGSAVPGTGGLFMARDSAGSVYAARIGTGTSETALRVVQASDAISSVNIASNIASLDVIQVSGSIASVNLTQTLGSATVVGTGYQDNALRVVHATDAIASVSIASNVAALDVIQVSGSIASVNLTQTLGSATVVGTGYQDNALRVVHATDAITSVYVTGSSGTTMIVGPVVADVADDGNAPIQFGGIARTANPTAVSGGDVVKASMDDLGRQLVRPVQVRDLIQTARVALSTGTETTLLAGSAGVFNDLIYVMAANNSDAAVSVDFRAATGANIQFTIQVPANGTAGVSLPVPIPQDVAADTWTADMADITGTTVSISALFSKEV